MKSIVLNVLEYGKQLCYISSGSHFKDVFSNNACQDHAREEETVQIYHASVISICLELGLGFRRQSVIIFGYLGPFSLEDLPRSVLGIALHLLLQINFGFIHQVW